MSRTPRHHAREYQLFALLITAATLIALAIVAVTDAQPEDQHSTFLVRIIARQLEDGRIEFGLRAGSNEHLPADRFVEPDVSHRRWLSSSVIPLGDTKGVRLIARRLASGWTEFGIRVEGIDTEHLPRTRFFPATVDHQRWLTSNRFGLELQSASPAPIIQRGPEPPCLNTGLESVPETAVIHDQLDQSCRSLRWPTSPVRYFPLTLEVQSHIRIRVSSDAVSPVVYVAAADTLPYYGPLAIDEPEPGADVYITTILQPGSYFVEVTTPRTEQGSFRLSFTSRPMPYGQISAGGRHTCMVTGSGEVACWGSNSDANGNESGQARPPAGQFVQVSAGGFHTCGLRPDGLIECWGSNEHGQRNAPRGHFVQVAAGALHTCALSTSGSVVCWGANDRGQTDVPDLSDSRITQITAGWYFSCGLAADGAARCWTAERPDWRVYWERFVQIDAGTYQICGLNSSKLRTCSSTSGGSGRGHGGDPHIEIAGGTQFVCTLRDSGAVTCVDDASSEDLPDWLSPSPPGPFARVTAGAQHICGITTNGRVECWGNNDYGQTDVPEALR